MTQEQKDKYVVANTVRDEARKCLLYEPNTEETWARYEAHIADEVSKWYGALAKCSVSSEIRDRVDELALEAESYDEYVLKAEAAGVSPVDEREYGVRHQISSPGQAVVTVDVEVPVRKVNVAMTLQVG